MKKKLAIAISAVILLISIVAAFYISQSFKAENSGQIQSSPSPSPTPSSNLASTPTPSPTSIPELFTPTFTATLTNASYTTPTTTSVDPQTGVTVTNPGHFVNEENLIFTIQNQPNATAYVIRWTTPFKTGWSELWATGWNATLGQSSGPETVLTLSGTYGSFVMETGHYVQGYSFAFSENGIINYESGATIVFQIQAVNGVSVTYHMIFGQPTYLIGVTSAWSQTESVTIP